MPAFFLTGQLEGIFMAKFGRKKMIAFEDVDFDPTEWEVRKSNPNYWYIDGVRKTDAVYAPSSPEIEKAYSEAGVELYRPSSANNGDTNEPQVEEEQVVEEQTTEESVDYESMSAADVKSIASQFTDEPVKTKAEALVVISKAVEEGKL